MNVQPDDSAPPRHWDFLAPPQQPGELGRLGQYRILKQLGQGGMGVVFQAEDPQLRRLAALKVLRPDVEAGEEVRARFLREARAAAALKHDHIVTIYQVGDERGVPFLAMEFLAGKSLEEWLRPDRRATVSETLVIGKQIARGLAVAHDVGLIHRDIKPANLWLEAPRGRVKILDFGLARQTAGEFTALTQNGAVLGTPAFMAPEQARGEVVDHRCDLFSFGCVLYRMVTGRLPFQGHTLYAVLAAVASQAPPAIRELNPDVPPRLAALIDRLLAKKPAERPASAQAVFEELQAIEKELKPQPVVAPPGVATATTVAYYSAASHRRWLLGAVAVAVTAVGVGTLLAWPRSKARPPAPAGETVPAALSPASAERAPQPAVGRAAPVALLPLIDVSRHVRRGQWSVGPKGRLHGRMTPDDKVKAFHLELPWEPPAEYRLKATVTRLSDDATHLTFGLSAGPGRFGFVVDSERDGKFFSALARPPVRIPDLPDARRGRILPHRLPVNLAMTVRPEGLLVEVNGQEAYRWRGDLTRLTRGASVPKNELLYVRGLQTGHFGFADLTLEPLGPDPGKPLSQRP